MATTSNKRKKAVAATVAAAAILLAGTFAWTSISQQAKNEAIVDINPGARLHDDFNGSNKDVYVENFNSADDAKSVAVYARIRLDQYMEVGPDAGINVENGTADRNVKAITGTDSKDKSTWVTYIPAGDKIDGTKVQAQNHWQWSLGNGEDNKPFYMPTFNMNKDSLLADINGTYEGTVKGDIVHYDDYIKYTATTDTATGTEIVDWDSDTLDEDGGTLSGQWSNGGITTDPNTPIDSADVLHREKQTHNAKQISETASVITMAQWQEMDDEQKAAQGYWVYDTDGWAYWSKAIEPGATTGLLLDGINMNKTPDENWYYAINVVGQFATPGDLSAFDQDAPTGGGGLTDAALALLTEITGLEAAYSIEGPTELAAGSSYNYTTVLKRLGVEVEEEPTETWSLTAEDSSVITLDKGTVTLSEDAEPGTSFQIQVEGKLKDGSSFTANKTITVSEPGPQVQKFLTVKKAGADEAEAVADGATILVTPGDVYTLGTIGKTVTWSGDYLTDTTLTVPDDMDSQTTWTVTATDSKNKNYTLNFLCGPLYDEVERCTYESSSGEESEIDAVQFTVIADMVGNDGNPYGETMALSYWADRYLPDGTAYYLTKTYHDVTQIVDRSQYGMSDLEVLEGHGIRDGFAIVLYIEPDTASGTKYDFNVAYEKGGKSYGHTASYTYADNTDGSITAGGNVTVTETPAAYTKDDALSISFSADKAGIAKCVEIDKTDADVEPEYTVSISAKDENGDDASTSECYFGTASENGQIKTYGFLLNKVSGYITENDGGGHTKTYPTITYTVTVTYTGTDGKTYGNEATVEVGQ